MASTSTLMIASAMSSNYGRTKRTCCTITDAIRQFIVVLAPDGTTLYANKVALESTGLTLCDLTDEGLLTRAGVAKPASVPGEAAWNQVWRLAAQLDDLDRIQVERKKGLSQGIPFDMEARLCFNTGQDEGGEVIPWYVTSTDIDDRKRAENQLRNEVLRKEIDCSSMFDDIVGSSRPMRQVLLQVEKVAALGSTVLILAEAGSGKELQVAEGAFTPTEFGKR